MRTQQTLIEPVEEIYKKFETTTRGRKLLQITGIDRDQLDILVMSQKYFSSQRISDISIDPNANVGACKSPSNYIAEVAKAYLKLNSFNELYPYVEAQTGSRKEAQDLLQGIIDGRWYFHDQTKTIMPYCIAVSTSHLMVHGRPYGQLHSMVPKRPDSFMAQVIEFVMDLSQEFAGAVAPADLVVNYAWYAARMEGITDKQIENDFQKFVHVVNNSFRLGQDSPFTNVSFFDETTLKTLFSEYRYPDGKSPLDEPYHSMIKRVQRIWCDFMARKDPKTGAPYRFPVVTLCLSATDGQLDDPEFLDMACKYNTEGIFNIFVGDGRGQIASCCRLTNSVEDMLKFRGIDSFGNGGINIGSTRVVTLNLPRVYYDSKGHNTTQLLVDRIKKVTYLLAAHRQLIRDIIEKRFLKFFNPLKWLSLDQMLFSTVGLIGIYEFSYLMGYDLFKEEDRKRFKKEILSLIEDTVKEQSLKLNIPINIEQVPGETAAITLCSKDRVFYPEIPFTMYSNQFIPLWIACDLFERATIDGDLDEHFAGGVISHLNIGSSVTEDQMRALIQFAVSTGLKHFALNPLFSVCKNQHVTLGDRIKQCPKCGEPIVDHITRIVGYFAPVSSWTKVRREWEFPRRKWNGFDE